MTPPENPATDDDAVIAHEPNQTILELIGKDVDLAEIFTVERIEACQDTINDARGNFFDVARQELAKLETLVKNQENGAKIGDTGFEDIATHAGNIKGHAEIFGFGFIAAIGNHIAAYCEAGAYAPAARLRLISDLVKMLHIAIEDKVIDETGARTRELNQSLKS